MDDFMQSSNLDNRVEYAGNPGENSKPKGKNTFLIVMLVLGVSALLLVGFFFLLGAVAYFGVLDPGKLLPDRVSLSPPFQNMASEHRIVAEDENTLVVALVNTQGGRIIVDDITVIDSLKICGSTGTVACIDTDNSADCSDSENLFDTDNKITWEGGDKHALILSCPGASGYPKGDIVRFNLSMNWYPAKSSPQFSKRAQGDMMFTIK